MRIEASELLKLQRRTAQDKTAASVPFRLSFLSLPQIGMAFAILEDGCVGEADRVAVETKVRCRAAFYKDERYESAELPKLCRCARIAGNHVKNALNRFHCNGLP
jgi:hypothetical protein